MIPRPVVLLSLIMLLCIQASLGSQDPEKKDNISSGEALLQTNTTLSSTYCQEVVNNLSGLINSLDFPDRLEQDAEKTDQDFDVNQYFMVLDRLSMQPGYVLDYVYFSDGVGGG
jgi:hypothetical protein